MKIGPNSQKSSWVEGAAGRVQGLRQLAGLAAASVLWLSVPALAIQPAEGAAPAAKPETDKTDAKESANANADAATVYILPLTGEFGRRVASQSLLEALDDVRKSQPDYLVVLFDFEWAFGGIRTNDLERARQSMVTWNAGMSAATEMSTLLTDRIRDDKKWVKKPKVIGWIRNAMGPSAILALVLRDLYYQPEARHGGIGYLDYILGGVDETVRQKQISLREGAVRGIGNKGGYDEMIVLSMTKTATVLSVTYEGGVPKLFTDDTGEELLTDDGIGGNADRLDDIVRGRGNDTLTLTADLAAKLRVSKGTAATRDELLDELGIVRNYKIIEGRAPAIFTNWERRVQNAERDMQEWARQAAETRAERDTPDARVAARGRQIGLYEKCRRALEQYDKSLAPEAVAEAFGTGDVEQARTQLGVRIEELKQQNMFERR